MTSPGSLLLSAPACLPVVLISLTLLAVFCAPSALAQPLGRSAGSSSPATWAHIDALRALLEASGSPVLQKDCGRRGLQGLYHQPSGTIVVCRVHRDPQAVWNTLAHEATHRMQACAGAPISRPALRQGMAQTLAAWAPQEWRSLQAYPSGQQLAELEARYTARLQPVQVLQLFRRYCGAGSRSPLTPDS